MANVLPRRRKREIRGCEHGGLRERQRLPRVSCVVIRRVTARGDRRGVKNLLLISPILPPPLPPSPSLSASPSLCFSTFIYVSHLTSLSFSFSLSLSLCNSQNIPPSPSRSPHHLSDAALVTSHPALSAPLTTSPPVVSGGLPWRAISHTHTHTHTQP